MNTLETAAFDSNTKSNAIKVLEELSQALLQHQYMGGYPTWDGGIICPADAIIHGCSSYSVLPFSLLFQETGEDKYLQAAQCNLDYVLNTQFASGFWNNDITNSWKGTSVFVILSQVKAFEILTSLKAISKEVEKKWKKSIVRCVDWLVSNPEVITWNTNYIISGGLAAQLAFNISQKLEYSRSAKQLIDFGLTRINSEGFLWGETVDSDDNPELSIDPGYNLEMSLPSLLLYALDADDNETLEKTLQLYRAHSCFIKSDGSLDIGFGSRGYKWTVLGSRSAHGVLMGLIPLSAVSSEVDTLTNTHLMLMKSMMSNGILMAGPHVSKSSSRLPCMIPTITKAAGLALGILYYDRIEGKCPECDVVTDHSDIKINEPCIAMHRDDRWEVTVSGVSFRGNKPVIRSAPPTGGAACWISHKKVGRIQIASQSRYLRVEPINMPDIEKPQISTPRFEIFDGMKTFSNVYDFDSTLKANGGLILANGILRTDQAEESGVEYEIRYSIEPDCLIKHYTIKTTDVAGEFCLTEPLVIEPDDRIVVKRNNVRIERNSMIISASIEVTPGTPDMKFAEELDTVFVDIPGIFILPFKAEGRLQTDRELDIALTLSVQEITDCR